jgi:hypothetical protein
VSIAPALSPLAVLPVAGLFTHRFRRVVARKVFAVPPR